MPQNKCADSTDRASVVKTIEHIRRLSSTRNGNPRFAFVFTDGTTANLAPDAALGYEIGNPGKREGSRVAVSYDENGHIVYMDTIG